MTPARSSIQISDPLRRRIADAHLMDEAKAVNALVEDARLPMEQAKRISERAARLVEGVRNRGPAMALDAFLQEYGLSTKEGVALMCLAEALLRIPDPETADRIIADKIGSGDWDSHLGQGSSLLVNASTWGLMLTGRVVGFETQEERQPWEFIQSLAGRAGAPVIRAAVTRAMGILGAEFVLGRTIDEALDAAKPGDRTGERFSFDMLGEAARTAKDANQYLAAYETAIDAIGAARAERSLLDASGISVKLSALHPRYQENQRDQVMDELLPRLAGLARRSKTAGIGMCIDAEESQHLDMSLDLVAALLRDPTLNSWSGLGVAVQAYQKRALSVLDWLYAQAEEADRMLAVRLVKGAYWDAEIKRAQELGLSGYPVFTRKRATDVSYLACAKKLFQMQDRIFPQFATHNAHTVAAVVEMAGTSGAYEFQRLHGMGAALYEEVRESGSASAVPVRVYAPVGSHQHLLSYLVRRLLENGANTSFVNRLQDAAVPVAQIVADPVARTAATDPKPHPRIPLPQDLFAPERQNSSGIDVSDRWAVAPLLEGVAQWAERGWSLARAGDSAPREIRNPADNRVAVGTVSDSSPEDLNTALDTAQTAAVGWDQAGADVRANCLERTANFLEQRRDEFVALAVFESGKTVADGIAEVREATDFCRYYAARARADFPCPLICRGPLANVITSHSMAGVSLPASVRGIFRWPFLWDK